MDRKESYPSKSFFNNFIRQRVNIAFIYFVFPLIAPTFYFINRESMKQTMIRIIFLLVLPTWLIGQDDSNTGPNYRIFSIYFGGGSYYIDKDQEQELYKWLDEIPELENQEISIHGHTDNIGSMQYNRMLSRYRCEAALLKLLNKDILREQITIEDFGEENPIYDNSTFKGKLKNRRVDVIIKPIVM